MNTTIERTALTQLVTNEQYARKVLPFIKKDYFSDKTERTIFEEITKFVDKYNKIPTQTSLEIEVQDRRDLNETEYGKVVEVIKTLKSTDVDFDWLVDTTEKLGTGDSYGNTDTTGYMVGVGVNRALGGFFGRASLSYTDYDDVSVTSTGGSKVKADVDQSALTFSIGKAF